jgi:hypothetical protein
MSDLQNKRLIVAKGFGFLIAGLLALAIIFLEYRHWKLVALVTVAIWCFARFYYFAFYVIEHYVDDGYHYAGVISFVRHWFRRRSERSAAGLTDEIGSPR